MILAIRSLQSWNPVPAPPGSRERRKSLRGGGGARGARAGQSAAGVCAINNCITRGRGSRSQARPLAFSRQGAGYVRGILILGGRIVETRRSEIFKRWAGWRMSPGFSAATLLPARSGDPEPRPPRKPPKARPGHSLAGAAKAVLGLQAGWVGRRGGNPARPSSPPLYPPPPSTFPDTFSRGDRFPLLLRARGLQGLMAGGEVQLLFSLSVKAAAAAATASSEETLPESLSAPPGSCRSRGATGSLECPGLAEE